MFSFVNIYRKNFTTRLFTLVLLFFTLIVSGISFMLFEDYQSIKEYQYISENLQKKQEALSKISYHTNQIFFRARGYYAFQNQMEYNKIFEEKIHLDDSIAKYRQFPLNKKETAMIESVESFLEDYFQSILPKAIGFVINEDYFSLRKLSSSGTNSVINELLTYTALSNDRSKIEISHHEERLIKSLSIKIQFLLVYLGSVLILFIFVMRKLSKNIGKPLRELTHQALKYTNGEVSDFKPLSRVDEIGQLSKTLHLMLANIQLKENTLLKQNEELMALISKNTAAEEQIKSTLKELQDIKFALDESAILEITDNKGTIIYTNEKFCQISKYTFDELVGKDHRIVNSNFHPKEFFTSLWNTISSGDIWSGEIKNKTKDGKYYWVNTTIVPFVDEDGNPFQYVVIRHDITAEKEAEQKLKEMNHNLEKLSMLDGLTKLPNRRSFDEELRVKGLEALNSANPLSLMLFDIDQFKLFNDRYGHLGGDACLKEIATEIASIVTKSGDFVARYGGEEFAIIMPATNNQQASVKAEDIRKSIENLQIPHESSEVSTWVTISVGVFTYFPNGDFDEQQIISAADKALYQAKNTGRNRVEISQHYLEATL